MGSKKKIINIDRHPNTSLTVPKTWKPVLTYLPFIHYSIWEGSYEFNKTSKSFILTAPFWFLLCWQVEEWCTQAPIVLILPKTSSSRKQYCNIFSQHIWMDTPQTNSGNENIQFILTWLAIKGRGSSHKLAIAIGWEKSQLLLGQWAQGFTASSKARAY